MKFFKEIPRPIIENIYVFKETRPGERRVALTPEKVPSLLEIDSNLKVFIETGAGMEADYSDADYVAYGAKIVEISPETKLQPNALILRIKRANLERENWEKLIFSKNTYMMGFLDPFDVNKNHIKLWQESGVTTFSLDQLTLPVNDSRNVLAAMSRIAGHLCAKDAVSRYRAENPRICVVGTGPAALSAVKYAVQNRLQVTVFGRSTQYKEPLREWSVSYVNFPNSHSKIDPTEFILPYLPNFNIVITAAREPGKEAPILINEAGLNILPRGTILVDLARGEGGNILGSKKDDIVILKKGIVIINVSGYPKLVPRLASNKYADGIVELVSDFISLRMDTECALINPCWITFNGKLNPKFSSLEASDLNFGINNIKAKL